MCSTAPEEFSAATARNGYASSHYERFSKLEVRLENAVGTEDYQAAAALRDELQKLRADEDFAVLAANSEFYRAFSAHDMERMEELWKPDGSITCSHPGFAPLHSRNEIMDSWRQVFGELNAQILPTDVRIMLLHGGTSAVVSCVERIMEASESKLVATNIFEKSQNGQWRLVLHHAGPLMVDIHEDSDDEDDHSTDEILGWS